MIILKKWFISKNYISDAAFKPNFVNFNYLNSARPKCGSLKQYNKTQKAWKKKALISGNAGDEKNFHPGGRKFFF